MSLIKANKAFKIVKGVKALYCNLIVVIKKGFDSFNPG